MVKTLEYRKISRLCQKNHAYGVLYLFRYPERMGNRVCFILFPEHKQDRAKCLLFIWTHSQLNIQKINKDVNICPSRDAKSRAFTVTVMRFRCSQTLTSYH